MASPPRTAREEERRLNLRTLVIASAASASAALVTSRLWIAGTWIAAAMTPVIVTLVSEMLRRPTERIARGITSDRAALPDPDAPPARPESAAAQRVAERLRGEGAPPLPDPDAPRAVGPTRVYRSEGSVRSSERGRKIAYRLVFGTAALAFVIGVLVLTVPELIAGGSFGKNDNRTTLFSGKQRDTSKDNSTTPQTTPEQQTETEEQPPPTTDETTPTETETTPTTPTTPEETAPTAPAPSDTTPVPPAEP